MLTVKRKQRDEKAYGDRGGAVLLWDDAGRQRVHNAGQRS